MILQRGDHQCTRLDGRAGYVDAVIRDALKKESLRDAAAKALDEVVLSIH
jgi:hypothetical protein